MSDATDFYQNIWPAHSEYAKRWLKRFPQWNPAGSTEEIHLLPQIQAWLDQARCAESEEDLLRTLRLVRQRSMIEIMRRDLLGHIELFDVTEALSFLADSSIQIALEFAHKAQVEKYGEPANGDCLIVVGMGKLGGLELNASSDIDLVYLYHNDGETQGGPNGKTQSHAEFFTQVARKLNRFISDVTDEGFVFRVDMRLRPNGDAGPLVASLDMLEEYFVVQGREWERYAWIKSRVVNWAVDASKDQAFQKAVEALNSIVRPFVYRKYLDFGAIRALRSLHHQIRAEVNKRELKHPGTVHVKLGRGGIREIEFSAQAFQLIRGGREPNLQLRRTVDVLEVCTEMGLLKPEVCTKLIAAYHFLRNLEHRIQYVDDAQTHRLPASPTELLRIARSMGYEDPSNFLRSLRMHMGFVAQHFDDSFGDKQEDEEIPELTVPWSPTLTEGFNDPETAESRFMHLMESPRYKILPLAHKERIDRVLPLLLTAASATLSPDSCWKYCLELIETIARRGAYLSLLEEYPIARMRVTRMLAASPWAASFLIRHPLLLDELIDSRTLMAKPNFDQWEEQTQMAMDQALTPDGEPDIERRMDLIREQHHAQLFRILAQDLENHCSVEEVSDWLSELADKTLNIVLQQAWAELPDRHRDKPRFAIIAYGKHGGKELGYASDLDMIFLFDDEDDRAPELYARLAKRINRWLTTYTGAGVLFETDYRLRPNGEAGLLVSTIDSFEAYERRQGGVGAWFWEYQALTRARFSVGDSRIGDRFEALRVEILCTPRDWASVKEEVLLMRQKMLEGHPNKTERFDVKHDRGGMVDVEFITQALVLAHSAKHPELAENKGNIALIRKAGELALIPDDLAQEVANAYRTLRAKQHALRLAGYSKSRTDDPAMFELKKPITALWNKVFEIGD